MPHAHRGDRTLPERISPSATARRHALIEWLRSGKALTTRLAAESLGVSRRTVARDLAHLRDAHGLAIEYNQTQGTYTLDDHHAAIPFIPHPDLWQVILNGELPDGSSDDTGAAYIRYSKRSVQAFEAASGMELGHAVDPQGRLEVRYALTNADDFVRWILSSGAEAEVLAPPELRSRVAMEIRRMLAVYEENEPQAP